MQPEGLATISLKFQAVRATGIMLEVYDTDAANKNVILAEIRCALLAS